MAQIYVSFKARDVLTQLNASFRTRDGNGRKGEKSFSFLAIKKRQTFAKSCQKKLVKRSTFVPFSTNICQVKFSFKDINSLSFVKKMFHSLA